MELVVDSNILFSAIISSGGKTRALLFYDALALFAPEFLLGEFAKHKQEILKKSKLPYNEFNLAMSLISSRITFVPLPEFRRFISKAGKVCPDANDTEFFALAMSKCIPLWSNDKVLKKQGVVKVLSTTELIKRFKFG